MEFMKRFSNQGFRSIGAFPKATPLRVQFSSPLFIDIHVYNSKLFTGGGLAFLAARASRLNRKQTGAYIVCGGFTKIGSPGALFCYIFPGEPGFALVSFYKLFEE